MPWLRRALLVLGVLTPATAFAVPPAFTNFVTRAALLAAVRPTDVVATTTTGDAVRSPGAVATTSLFRSSFDDNVAGSVGVFTPNPGLVGLIQFRPVGEVRGFGVAFTALDAGTFVRSVSGQNLAGDLVLGMNESGYLGYLFDDGQTSSCPGTPSGLCTVNVDLQNFTLDSRLRIDRIDVVTSNVVPEPATVALTATGLVLVALRARRRRRAATT